MRQKLRLVLSGALRPSRTLNSCVDTNKCWDFDGNGADHNSGFSEKGVHFVLSNSVKSYALNTNAFQAWLQKHIIGFRHVRF